jgi:DNA-binding response OmpR family regulator
MPLKLLSEERAVSQNGRVLVVEDDSPIRSMLSDVLTDAGFGVLAASDGYEALQLLHAARPDLIVLDLMLPRMSGWAFLERAQGELSRANIPVVILSAIRGEGDYPDMLGVAAWLTKPIDIDRFLAAIEQVSATSRRANSQAIGPSTHKRVLIVEDEPHIRDLLHEYLTGDGYTTDLAGTISEARERIRSSPPSLIVLDLMLPGQSGWDFLSERQSDPALARIPIVVISAAQQSRLMEAKNLGANAFLSKPFDVDAISALLSTYAG